MIPPSQGDIPCQCLPSHRVKPSEKECVPRITHAATAPGTPPPPCQPQAVIAMYLPRYACTCVFAVLGMNPCPMSACLRLPFQLIQGRQAPPTKDSIAALTFSHSPPFSLQVHIKRTRPHNPAVLDHRRADMTRLSRPASVQTRRRPATLSSAPIMRSYLRPC